MGKRKKKKIEDSAVAVRSPTQKKSLICDDNDEDDDLPSPFKPISKNPGDFKQGDLVFAKFKRFPFWPAVFYKYNHNRQKLSQAFVHFFERATEDDHKTVLRVSLSKIKSFTCEERVEYVKEVAKNDDFKFGMESANDYLTKRALGKISDFFATIEEEEEEEEDGNNDTDEDDNRNDKSNEEFKKENDDEQNEGTVNKKSVKVHLFRKSRRVESARCQDITSWIKTNAKSILYEIALGVRCSTRHDTFFNGSQKEKDKLKWSSGFGPLGEKEAGRMLKLLLSWYNSQFPGKKLNPVTYVSEVWVPEAIIYGISKTRNLSMMEAEKVYLS